MRFAIAFLALLIVVSAPFTTYAVDPPPTTQPPPTTPAPPATQTSPATPAPSAVDVGSGSVNVGSSGNGCSYTDLTTWPNCLGRGIAAIILTFASFLLGIAGVLFNWVVVKTVFGFATLIGNSPGLLIAWGILRDVGNMALLFGFIFLGIAMMLDLHSYPVKKALPRLIIFAILMNFSLFAAEAVVDVSNVLSSTLYNQANTDPCIVTEAGGGGSRESCAINGGISGHIMQSTGISSIYTFTGSGSFLNINISTLLGLSLLATIAAVVLFAAAIMLIIRAVTLTLLMVVAPLGFAALAIPPLEKIGKEWWHKLIHQAFFAPILLLLFFVSLKITDSFTVTGSGTRQSLANALSQPNSGTMGIIMVFALVIGFLIASLIAAKKFGAMGAEFAIKTATGFTAGSMAFAGRNTFGRASGLVGQGVRNSRIGGTEGGRYIAGLFDRGKAASYDLRAAGINQIPGIEFGKAGKGLTDRQKNTEKARIKYAESLEQTEAEKYRTNVLKQQKQEEEEESKKTHAKINEEREAARKRTKRYDKDIEAQEKKIDANESGETLRKLNEDLENARNKAADANAAGDGDGAAKARTEAAGLERAIQNLERTKRDDVARLEQLKEARRREEETFTGLLEGFDARTRAEEKRKKEAIDAIDLEIRKNNPQERYASHLEDVQLKFTGRTQRTRAAEKIRGRLKESKSERRLREIGEKLDEGGHKTDELKDRITKEGKEARETADEHDHDDDQ